MKNRNNGRRDDQNSSAEQAIVRILSQIRWMDSQSRTHQAVRQLRKACSLEFFEHWLTGISALNFTTNDTPPLDQFVMFVDPFDSLTIEELAEMIAHPTVINCFSESLNNSGAPSPSVRDVEIAYVELTPNASKILARLDIEHSGSFTTDLLASIRGRMSPASFELIAAKIECISACYSDLKPVYCNTPLAEVVRETRRILKHRWHTDQLTPDDVAVFVDQSMLREVEQSMLKRRH